MAFMYPSAPPGQRIQQRPLPMAAPPTETRDVISSHAGGSPSTAINTPPSTGRFIRDLDTSALTPVSFAAHDDGSTQTSQSMCEPDAQGTADDPIVLSPDLSPVSLLIPISPVIYAVDVLVPSPAVAPSLVHLATPASDGAQRLMDSAEDAPPIPAISKEPLHTRNGSTGNAEPQSVSSKGAVAYQPYHVPYTFQASDQTFMPRGQCIHQLRTARSNQARGQSSDIHPQYHCVQRLCKEFDSVDADIRPAMIISIDCIGFMVPFGVLQTAR